MTFMAAVGSVTGREHVRCARNNQDASLAFAGEGRVVACVTDGCSEGRASEVGAQLAAAWMVRFLAGEAEPTSAEEAAALAGRATEGLAGFLAQLVAGLGAAPEAAVADYLLFTFLAVLAGERSYTVFGLGDGVYALNGELRVLDRGPAPPYLGYRLLGAQELPRPPVALLAFGPAAELRSLCLATDGARALPAEALAELGRPPVFRNPSLLNKRLRALADARRCLWDDTSLILIQRPGEGV